MATVSLYSVQQASAEDRIKTVSDYLSNQPIITSEALNTIAGLLAQRTGLLGTALNLISNVKLSDVVRDLPTACPNVKILSLDSAAELETIAAIFNNIEELSFRKNPIYPTDLETVQRHCKNLRRLEVENAEHINASGIEKLTEECTHLSNLILKNCACLTPAQERSFKERGINIVQQLPYDVDRDAEGRLWAFVPTIARKTARGHVTYYETNRVRLGEAVVLGSVRSQRPPQPVAAPEEEYSDTLW